MVKKIFNWTFSDVDKFLRSYHFTHTHTEGSHYYYTGNYGGQPRIVHVPFHGSKTFKPKTLKGMILQSGIPQNFWLSGDILVDLLISQT